MKKVNTHASWESFVYIEQDKDIDIYIDRAINTKRSGVTTILLLQEPVRKWWKWARENQDKYDYLFTYFKDLLDIDKAVYFYCPTAFVRPYKKTFKRDEVSYVMSGRLNNKGHYLRYELHKRWNEITYPKRLFYSSRVTFKGEKHKDAEHLKYDGNFQKEPVLYSYYHIAIDTEDEFFNSEKLIDCFLMKSIPIYWGPKHYEGEFAKEGVLHAENVDEIITICNTLKDYDLYRELEEAMEFNYHKALRYTDFNEYLSEKIKHLI